MFNYRLQRSPIGVRYSISTQYVPSNLLFTSLPIRDVIHLGSRSRKQKVMCEIASNKHLPLNAKSDVQRRALKKKQRKNRKRKENIETKVNGPTSTRFCTELCYLMRLVFFSFFFLPSYIWLCLKQSSLLFCSLSLGGVGRDGTLRSEHSEPTLHPPSNPDVLASTVDPHLVSFIRVLFLFIYSNSLVCLLSKSTLLVLLAYCTAILCRM